MSAEEHLGKFLATDERVFGAIMPETAYKAMESFAQEVADKQSIEFLVWCRNNVTNGLTAQQCLAKYHQERKKA